MSSLPTFAYHPDPVASGSVVESQAACHCCGQQRGYVYSGPVYSETDLDDALCPWCIASGEAHRRFQATFVDEEVFADEVPPAVIDEIAQRTPGYCAWNSEAWPHCCGDATAFLSPLSIGELRTTARQAEGQLMGYIVHEMGISGGAAWRLMEALSRDAAPTLYLFRCRHCAQYHFHIEML
jgi:uncharacterized protein CbrC (UPF0167 family)